MVTACSIAADTVCRSCLYGFTPVNGSCHLQELEVDGGKTVAIMMLIIVEILVVAAAWRWWRLRRHYLPVTTQATAEPY